MRPCPADIDNIIGRSDRVLCDSRTNTHSACVQTCSHNTRGTRPGTHTLLPMRCMLVRAELGRTRHTSEYTVVAFYHSAASVYYHTILVHMPWHTTLWPITCGIGPPGRQVSMHGNARFSTRVLGHGPVRHKRCQKSRCYPISCSIYTARRSWKDTPRFFGILGQNSKIHRDKS